MTKSETGVKKKKAAAKKPSEGKKKTAAKRTPDPVPVDPLVVSVGDMPPVPMLRHALVSWGTGQGHQADQDTALLARELCEKSCHFCGAPSSPTMALGTPWTKVELCACLERASPGIDVYTSAMKGLGHTFSGAQAPVLTTSKSSDVVSDFKRKYGSVRLMTDHYQEFFPDWKNRIPEIMELARKRILSHREFIYANQCACGTDFSVTAGMIVRSMNKHGSHIEMKKCKSCRDQREQGRDDTHANLEAPIGGEEGAAVPALNEPSGEKIARPKKKNKRPRNGLVTLPTTDTLVATTGAEGNATFGDVLGPALARLQEAS